MVHLATLESYGVPYLAPISPYIARDVSQGLFRKPVKDMFRRPKVLRTKDSTRKGG
ncbi:spore germination protein [Paenibacillus chibensis]|uniref:Spore germination protein n=1 Tax=Paenibacillus chibensis TaxID=59846 RepID=A0ABU6Q0Q1_9BACL|nr:spore germination protein [Paenibacillus chibensis]